MANDYLPSTDAGLLQFATNMSNQVTAAPIPLGLTAAIATQLASLTSTYEAKLLLATGDLTRSKSNTFAKNQAKKALIAYIRQIVGTVQGTVSVTPQQKEDLGITVRGENPPTPINPPTQAPIFEVLWVKNRLIGVQLRQPESDSRGKPAGVQGCSVCMYSGQLPVPTDITQWITIGESSRNKFEVELPVTIPAGTTVHLVAFWKSPRLMSGPPSAVVPVTIGGGVQQVG